MLSSKESFLVTFSEFIIQNYKDGSFKKCLSEANEALIVNHLIYLLNKYSICVVFDALNDFNDDLFSFTQILNEKITNSKIIITTTQDFEILSWYNHPLKIKLEGLSIESFALACELYNLEQINNDEFDSLYRLTGGHPYLLKLAASLLVYQPIGDLMISLNNGNVNDFEAYVSSKIISKLSLEETKLISYVLTLEIPFRYTLGDYLIDISFPSTLKSLQQKFLIEKTKDDFFIIPEYIKLNIHGIKNESPRSLEVKLLFKYLKSIQNNPRLIEKIALIDLSIEIGEIDFAKEECMRFVSNLMGIGYFNLITKYAEEFIASNREYNWDFLFYALGRVYRMQTNYEKALEMYNKGINSNLNSKLYHPFLFEKASVLFYLSQINDDNNYKDESIEIYKNLSNSENLSISIQSQLGLSRILVKDNKQKEAIKRIKKVIDSIDFKSLDLHVAAQLWHSLGDAYSKDGLHKNAFESFDVSIDYYQETLNKNGLNAFEGLYHLYISYATTYSDAKDYISAAEMFAINVSLAKEFGLERKLERALLDYGYHLILSEQFDKAIESLNEHYKVITINNTIDASELPFLYGCLLFGFWYSNNFLNSLELLGLYVNASNYNDRKPLVTIIEKINESEDFDVIEYFKKGMKILILPENKNFDDLKSWINEVCIRKPELLNSLNSFLIFKKSD